MNVALNRKQELKLIKLGLQQVLDGLNGESKTTRSEAAKRGWSAARHKKFQQTMKRKFGKK